MQEPRSETNCETAVQRGSPTGVPAHFEEAYLQYGPLLRKIAVGKFGLSESDAEPLVHDVFATYLTTAGEVLDVRRYLIGGICNAARHHQRRTSAANELFCGDSHCMAEPTESISAAVERKLLLRRILPRIGGRCRDLLFRYYVHGDTTQAIASDLGFKPSTILIFLSKCRQCFRVAYKAVTERQP